MRVYILDNGWLECDSNMMVAGKVTGTADNKNPRTEWIKIPVYAVLIEHEGGRILFDTGCHPDAMNGYWPAGLKTVFPYYFHENQRLENRLSLIGLKPGDIGTVILSHMHLDHAGNINLFTHAEVYVHKKDFEYGQTLVHISQDRARHGAYIKEDVEAPVKGYRLVEEDFTIVPGVEVITLPGHTPGVLGLVVSLEKEGTLIFPQDALYTRENYGPPAKASGIVYDSLAFFRSVEKVRRLEKERNAKVMFSHDMEFFKSVKKAPEYYE